MAGGTAMIISAIIGAAVGVGSGIAGSVIDANAADEANERSMRLYNQQKADDERIRKENMNLARLDRRYRQQELAFAKEKFETEKEKFDYQKRQQNFANTLGILNANQAARNTFFELWNRRAAA